MERDDILASTSPAALFGDAVQNARELRRAYARLAKAHRSDTQVAAHIRTLFEAAKEHLANPGAQAVKQTEGEPNEPQQWTSEDYVDEVFTNRSFWFEQSERLSNNLLACLHPNLSNDSLSKIQSLLADARWEVGWNESMSMHLRLSTLQAIYRAKEDPTLHPAAAQFFGSIYSEHPVSFATAANTLRSAMNQEERKQMWVQVEHDYPALFRLYRKNLDETLSLVSAHPLDLGAFVPELDDNWGWLGKSIIIACFVLLIVAMNVVMFLFIPVIRAVSLGASIFLLRVGYDTVFTEALNVLEAACPPDVDPVDHELILEEANKSDETMFEPQHSQARRCLRYATNLGMLPQEVAMVAMSHKPANWSPEEAMLSIDRDPDAFVYYMNKKIMNRVTQLVNGLEEEHG